MAATTQTDPGHNTNALLIGTGEFAFSEDASTVLEAQATGYLDFGNIAAFTPKTDTQKLEHKGAYRGVLRLDKTAVTESKVQYQLKCDEWNMKNLQIIFGGGSLTPVTQAVLSSAAGGTLDFTTTGNFVIGKWYDLLTAGGARVHDLTALSCSGTSAGGLSEGTNYVSDLLLGRVKFLTSLNGENVTTTLTGAAITTASETFFESFIPLVNVRRQGIGSLVCFDQYASNKVVFKHTGFSCEITLDSTDEIGGSAFSNITMTVNTTELPGTVVTRLANLNQGQSAAT